MAIHLEPAFLFEEAADEMPDDHGDGEAFTPGDVIELIEAGRIEPNGDFPIQIHDCTSGAAAGQRVAARESAPWPAPRAWRQNEVVTVTG